MDLQSLMISIFVFVLSAAILILIYKFGMREKSYEEAIAEQRKLTGNLLGSNDRLKVKKQKKNGKKVKEKTSVESNSNGNESETKETPNIVESSVSKPHVEFEEPPVVEVAPTAPNPKQKRKNKETKIKPILLNKEYVPKVEGKTTVVNNFDKIHPKDDYELLQSQLDEEETPVVEVKHTKTNKAKQSEKVTNESQKPAKATNKEKKQNQQQHPVVASPPVVEQPIPVTPPKPQSNTVPPTNNNSGNSIKDKKKKKSEFNTLQQLTVSDKHDINLSLLVPLVRKADLSRSEIQILIDLLLNKQHDAPAIVDEWTEGRADVIQRLKRQLAEKERAVTTKDEALISTQTKLRELRAEINSERAHTIRVHRNLEESLMVKNKELQSINSQMQTQQQKIQQLQAQNNEEIMAAHKLREELNTLKLQRQQLDILLNQKQEAETNFQAQLNQLRNELQEQQNVNTQLNMEIRNLREGNHAETEMLHERIRQMENQTMLMRNESDQTQSLARQLETEMKLRCQKLREEALRFEVGQATALEELAELQNEINRLNHLHKQQIEDNRRVIHELQTQVSNLKSENSQLLLVSETKAIDEDKEKEIAHLQNELASLRVHLQQRETQLELKIEELQKSVQGFEIEVKNQREKNDELRKKNWKMMDALNTAEASLRSKQTNSVDNNDENLKKLKLEEQKKYRDFIQRLFTDIELPQSENWMKNTESAIKKYLNELKEKTQKDSIQISQLHGTIKQYTNIIEDTEKTLNYLQLKIQSEETKWRDLIASKDLEIRTLQDKIKTEYKNSSPVLMGWCNDSKNRDNAIYDENGVQFAYTCIERSLPLIVEEMQSKINILENALANERCQIKKLQSNFHALQLNLQVNSNDRQTNSKQTQINNEVADLGQIEKLNEEKILLTDQLNFEQNRNQELTDEILRLKSNDSLPPSVKTVQHCTANGTSLQSVELASSASSSSISSTSNKPRNKNKKKKVANNN